MSLMQAAAKAAPPADEQDDPTAAPADDSAGAPDDASAPADDTGGDMPTTPTGKRPAGAFVAKDISQVVPPEQMDAVQRIVAAGMQLMYDPAQRKQLMAAVASPDPVPKTMAMSVVGIILVLSKKAPSGLPPAAIMPAEYELMIEAGTVLEKAGKTVTQDDFNAALQLAFALTGKKMGASDAEIMDAAHKALPPDQQDQTADTSPTSGADDATQAVGDDAGAPDDDSAGPETQPPDDDEPPQGA